MKDKTLYEELGSKAFGLGITKPTIPNYIKDNLKYDFFDWQEKALENLLTYNEIKQKENNINHTHLLFNMATGTGKTMLMASTILYYYKQGYRHFIFFVNQNNIIDKTENNFIDNTHNKYLFKDKIIIEDKTIDIKKVNTFSDEPQGIEIKFTSIHKLYNDIHLEKENNTTLQDLNNKDIILLADEAHHLNASTSKSIQGTIDIDEELKGSKEEVERKGWEDTVINLILKKNNTTKENKNVLLEFTATVPSNKNVEDKYKDKIIYKFGLKEFLQAGYTKEINLISSTLEKKERVLQALFFGWYRHKIALKYNISNFKPVVLFRSKTIEESKKDHEDFLNLSNNITSKDFDFIKTISEKLNDSNSIYEQGKSRTEKVLKFINNNNISFREIAEWIKNNYTEKNTIITNSKDGTKTKEKTNDNQEQLLNSLENTNNHIRAIFTVERLTEGWDVLNLFDIVRLYQGQNAGGSDKKIPASTTKEKQLIGRGVRYYPFNYKEKQRNKRKFDNDLNNDLRVLEELYYYTYDEESRYISHLKQELKRDGYIKEDENKEIRKFSIKDSFKETDFYKKVKVWGNKRIDNPNKKQNTLEIINEDFILNYKIKGIEYNEELFNFEDKDQLKNSIKEEGLKTLSIKLENIEKHIFLKALNIKAQENNSIYQFNKLKELLNIDSIEKLQKDKLKGFKINIIVNNNISIDDIDNKDKLEISLKVLNKVFGDLKKSVNEKIGSEFRARTFKEVFGEPKEKIILKDKLKNGIPENEWYVLDGFAGTDQEENLVNFIKKTIGNLEKKYKEIYLLRNEEVYKIYNFEDGRGFQPDFLLFLGENNNNNIHYQVFIEPKQENLMTSENEIWKEEFLLKILEEYGDDNILKSENKEYKLIGLPFYNSSKNNFEESFKSTLKIK